MLAFGLGLALALVALGDRRRCRGALAGSLGERSNVDFVVVRAAEGDFEAHGLERGGRGSGRRGWRRRARAGPARLGLRRGGGWFSARGGLVSGLGLGGLLLDFSVDIVHDDGGGLV